MPLHRNMSQSPKKPIITLSVDIEASGPNYTKHGILGLGWCTRDSAGNIKSGQINMYLPEGADFEQKCWEEFWSKNLPVLHKLKENAVSPLEGITAFINLLDQLEQDNDVMIITDNPSFDISYLNYYLATYLNRNPLTYDSFGNYRPIFDTDCYTRGVLHMQYDNKWTSDSDIIAHLNIDTSEFAAHTHTPESDATRICQLHAAVLSKLKSLDSA